MRQSLCVTCGQARTIVSGKGSRFLLCQKWADDRRFPKYPPQPVERCEGYEEVARRATPPEE